jgi:hypothetical protein
MTSTMKYIRSLPLRSSTWAFLSAVTFLGAIGAVRDAVDVNFTSWLHDYDALAMCAAFATFAGFWISRTRAELRVEALVIGSATTRLPH